MEKHLVTITITAYQKEDKKSNTTKTFKADVADELRLAIIDFITELPYKKFWLESDMYLDDYSLEVGDVLSRAYIAMFDNPID
jgi:hypothetical protein